MKEIVHCWEDAQFVLSPSLLAPRKLDLTPSQADIHPFWLWPFFPALELFALETHFTINLFIFSSSPISRNLHSFQVYPSLQKIFFLSLSGSSFTAMGKMNKGHSNMWKSFINCDWDWCPTGGVPYPQWGLPKCADLISLYLTPNKMP